MHAVVEWLDGLPPEVLVPAFIIVRALAIVLPPVQGWPLDILAERVWGWKQGLIISECGVTLGALSAYWIGGAVSSYALKHVRLLQRARDWEASFGNRRWAAWFALRLVSNPLFDGLSYAAGILRLPFGTYVSTTVLGSLPTMALFMWGVSRTAEVGVWQLLLFGIGFVGLSVLVAERFIRR